MKQLKIHLALGAWFVGGALATLAVAAVAWPSALVSPASAAPACIADGDYGQIGTVEDPANATSDDIRGTQSEMFIANGPTSCQRISSIYVFSPTYEGLFEFGWVIGYSNCSGATYTTPHLFYWAETATTSVTHCGVFSSPLPVGGQYDTLRASDVNGDTYWGGTFNGTGLQPAGINMDFARGHSLAGMERGASTDSGIARWNSLSEYHDANGWTHWDNATRQSDTDPDYHYNRDNAYTVSSEHD